MADKGGIQLLPETRKKIEVRTPGENRLFGIGLLVAAVVGGIYFGLNFYVQSLESEVYSIDDQIRALEEQRDKKVETALAALSYQTNFVGQVLANQIFMTQALDKVEVLLHPDVQVKSAEFSFSKQAVSLQTQGKSLMAVARQMNAFLGGDFISDVVIGKLTPGENNAVETGFELKLDANKLFKKTQK